MTPVAASLISAIILTTVLTVMWRNHGERWLGLWAIAAALWTVRYVLAVIAGEYRYVPGVQLLPLLALARGFFLLWGSYVLAGRGFPRVWMATFGADVGLIVIEWLTRDFVIFGAPGVTHYALFGGATVWSALLVFQARRTLGNEALLVAIGLMGIGLTNLTFPWTSRQPEMSMALFLAAHASQLLIGFGALMVFYSRANAERDAANARLEAALEKALSGYLPICAHCKAIKSDTGDWESLERYLTVRHDAAFSHGICPTCAEAHYGELLRGTEEPRGARSEGKERGARGQREE
jgi:hypothetical protein